MSEVFVEQPRLHQVWVRVACPVLNLDVMKNKLLKNRNFTPIMKQYCLERWNMNIPCPFTNISMCILNTSLGFSHFLSGRNFSAGNCFVHIHWVQYTIYSTGYNVQCTVNSRCAICHGCTDIVRVKYLVFW